MYDVNQK